LLKKSSTLKVLPFILLYKSDAQYFRQLFEKRKPVIDGKKVVIWTMQQLLLATFFCIFTAPFPLFHDI
jgi:hypothetical protein